MKSKKSATETQSKPTTFPDRHSAYVVSGKGDWTPEKTFALYQMIANLELWRRPIDIPRASGMDIS